MPRIRTLKPEIWEDEALGRCPRDARLLYVGMITQADDEGRLRAAPARLRSAVFPYDDIPTTDVAAWLDCLAGEDLIRVYTVKGETYAELTGWHHQRVDRPSQSSLPPFDQRDRDRIAATAGDSTNAREDSSNPREHSTLDLEGKGSGKEGKGEDQEQQHVQLANEQHQDQISIIWNAYERHHPRAVLTADRRRLIKSRLRQHDTTRLLEAIEGNHLDPHCNGQNPHGKTYHDLGLILRDADHIERYAAIARNGHQPTTAAGRTLARALALAQEGR